MFYRYSSSKSEFIFLLVMDSFHIISLNVGLSSTLAGLTNLLCTEKIDIALLQEVRSSEEDINSLVNSLGYQVE